MHATTAFLASNFYAGQHPKPQHRFLHQGNPVLVPKQGLLHMHIFSFYYTKAMPMKHEHRNNALTTTAVGLHHKGALNN